MLFLAQDTFRGVMDPDEYYNPVFYNWNQIYFKYCDGTSFSGNLDTPLQFEGNEIWFQGKIILKNGLLDLLANGHFQNPDKIVLSGKILYFVEFYCAKLIFNSR